jgi:hypothetical protein
MEENDKLRYVKKICFDQTILKSDKVTTHMVHCNSYVKNAES